MEASPITDLVRRHAGLIHKVAYAYCRDATDREEVVQEVAVELWRSRHRYDERYEETTWAYRIALNVAISFHRRERRHRERREPIDAHAITIAAASEVEPGEGVQLLLGCIEDLGRIQVVDVVLPIVNGPELRLRCVTDPDKAQAALLYRLGLRLPKRLHRPEQLAKCSGKLP